MAAGRRDAWGKEKPDMDSTRLVHKGKTLIEGERDQVLQHLKQTGLADGEYHVVGPRLDLTVWRSGGVLYPLRGVIDGEEIPSRTREQAKAYFKDKSPLV